MISVKDLAKVYHIGDVSVHAVRQISLEIATGEFVSVIGPSGSGKSTFMHIIGCLDRPSSGAYSLDGHDVSRLSDDELSAIRNKQIGFVFQGFNLLARTSAVENVELPLLYANSSTIPRFFSPTSRPAISTAARVSRSWTSFSGSTASAELRSS